MLHFTCGGEALQKDVNLALKSHIRKIDNLRTAAKIIPLEEKILFAGFIHGKVLAERNLVEFQVESRLKLVSSDLTAADPYIKHVR